MKIIKKGTKTPPDKRIYITKCRTCGCVFTYMEKDKNNTNVKSKENTKEVRNANKSNRFNK